MPKAELNLILSLLTDEEDGAWNIQEIYHALLEYIKSGTAISDMGHPDFMRGARGNEHVTDNSSYSPKSTIFKLASACSTYLSNYDMEYMWYRDLSTWENFCKYVVELKQINYFKRHFAKVVKSHKHYIGRKLCPSCGTMRYNDVDDRTDEIYLEHKGSKVFINCRRCGKYVLTHTAFQCLGTFEKKAKLYVFLSTRLNRDSEYDLILSPKNVRKIIE